MRPTANATGIPRSINRQARNLARQRALAQQLLYAICDRPIDDAIAWSDPMSAEVDEIIPVSRGGSATDLRPCFPPDFRSTNLTPRSASARFKIFHALLAAIPMDLYAADKEPFSLVNDNNCATPFPKSGSSIKTLTLKSKRFGKYDFMSTTLFRIHSLDKYKLYIQDIIRLLQGVQVLLHLLYHLP